MTRRDRLVVIGVAAAVILAAVWLLLVSPEQKQAASLNEQVATARQSLNSAQAKLNEARTAQSKYNNAYASIVRMGEAVPANAEVPALVYELDQLSNSKHVSFNSITASGTGSTSGSSASSRSTVASSSSGLSQLPFTFAFSGNFFDLYNLFTRLDGLAVQTASGEVQISGRILTIQSINLAVEAAGSASTSKGKELTLTGTVTAAAYTLPAGQGLTGGATQAGPAGSSLATAPQPASTTKSTSPSTPAAVTQVTP